MLSRLDPLMKVMSRVVEGADAKMGIRKDESETNGKGEDGNANQQAQPIPWEDTTEVSLEALQNFLQGLLYGDAGGLENAAPDTPPSVLPETSNTAANLTPERQAASRATRAYQTTGRMVHDKNVEGTEKKYLTAANPSSSVSLGSDFGPEERAMMEGFIADLQALSREGRNVLVLQRSLTFLESIRQGIEQARGV